MGGGMGMGGGMDPMGGNLSPQPSFGAMAGTMPTPNMPSPWQKAAMAMQAVNAFKAAGAMSPGVQGAGPTGVGLQAGMDAQGMAGATPAGGLSPWQRAALAMQNSAFSTPNTAETYNPTFGGV